MDERPEPEHIEIELTSHEAAGRPPDSRPPTTSPVPPEPRTRWLESERGRLLAATAFVGVLALIVGILVGGRAGSDEPRAVDDARSPETTVPSTAADDEAPTTPATIENARSLPPPDLTTTIDASPPTSDSDSRQVLPTAPGESSVIRIAPEFADLPVELIVRQEDGDVVAVDLATGSAVRLDAPRGSIGGTDSFMNAGPGWILFTDPSLGSSSILFDDGTFERTAFGNGPVFVNLMADVMWVLDFGFETDSWSMQELQMDGTPTGREVDIADVAGSVGQGVWPRAADPLGGVFVNAPGGTYTVGGDTPNQVTSGWLVAGGATTLFALECDDTLECGYVVIDRASGERRAIELNQELGEATQLDAGLWGQGDAAFDPAEQRLLMSIWNSDGSGSFGVLDLESGDYTSIAPNSPLSMRWSPDGRFVLWLSTDGDLQVFDPASGESVPLSDDLDDVQAFALRSAIPDSDG